MKNVFKILTVVCFVAAMTTFTSCKKSNEDLIVGTWKCTSVQTVPADPFANLLAGVIFTFNADKTMAVNSFGENGKGTYSIKGNTLTMTVENDPRTAEIKTLDKKKLTFSYDEVDDEDGSTINITMNFDKQ